LNLFFVEVLGKRTGCVFQRAGETLPNLGVVTSDKARGATAHFWVKHNHANPLPRVHTLLEHEIADIILQGLHLEAHSIVPNTWQKMGLCQVRLCADH